MNKISKAQFEFYKRQHWNLWDWLSKHPNKAKEHWFNRFCSKNIRILNQCFACEFSRAICGRLNCRFCPITKPNKYGAFACCNELYDNYFMAYMKDNYDLVASIAEQIRDLPWDKNNILDYVED